DDGFAAYINGVKVADYNAPSTLNWNSSAPDAADAEGVSIFDLSAFINVLREGTNLLAIQGLNVNPQSSDFLILPVLTVGKFSQGGTISPGAIKYENPVQITKTLRLNVRSLTGSTWSALNSADFIV